MTVHFDALISKTRRYLLLDLCFCIEFCSYRSAWGRYLLFCTCLMLVSTLGVEFSLHDGYY